MAITTIHTKSGVGKVILYTVVIIVVVAFVVSGLQWLQKTVPWLSWISVPFLGIGSTSIPSTGGGASTGGTTTTQTSTVSGPTNCAQNPTAALTLQDAGNFTDIGASTMNYIVQYGANGPWLPAATLAKGSNTLSGTPWVGQPINVIAYNATYYPQLFTVANATCGANPISGSLFRIGTMSLSAGNTSSLSNNYLPIANGASANIYFQIKDTSATSGIWHPVAVIYYNSSNIPSSGLSVAGMTPISLSSARLANANSGYQFAAFDPKLTQSGGTGVFNPLATTGPGLTSGINSASNPTSQIYTASVQSKGTFSYTTCDSSSTGTEGVNATLVKIRIVDLAPWVVNSGNGASGNTAIAAGTTFPINSIAYGPETANLAVTGASDTADTTFRAC